MCACILFCSLLSIVPGTFQQRKVSSKSNCNKNFQRQPAGLMAPLKELLPYNTHFYMAFNFQLPHFIGITTFIRPVFLFEINHDDDTVMGILSHLNTGYGPYIYQSTSCL